MSSLAVLVLALGFAQDPSDPSPLRRARAVRVHSEVRVLIEEAPEGEYDHDHYEQQAPVEYQSGTSRLRSRVWSLTVCRPQDEDRAPIFLPPSTATPTSLPLSLSAAFGAPRFSVTTTRSLSTIGGNSRTDPIITKPALFSGGGGPDSATSSDAPFLTGPDFDLVLASDVTAWSPMRWMPGDTSLHVYARALFGSFEVFDTPTRIQLYGIGPRLAVPLAKAGSLEFGLTVSAGPAFLRTGIGDAVGFDGGIGLRLEQVFAPGFSFIAAAEANLYFSENVTAFGPVVHLGINLSW